MINPRHYYTRVIGWQECPAQPEPIGIRSMSYPWDAMEPGHVIFVRDPSDAARNRLAAAASQAAKRLGVRFSTGQLWPGSPGFGEPVGWWCIRHDGCELTEPEPTTDQLRGHEYAIKKGDRRKAKARGPFRRTRIEPLSRLGDFEPDAAVVVPEAPADEADAWLRPREAGEVF